MPSSRTTGPPPCLILLNGFPGVGKLTISQALQASFPAGTKSHLIDVHMIIDAVSKRETIEERTAARSDYLHNVLLKGHGKDEVIVMTAGFANENEYDVEQWLDYARVARERGGVMIHVSYSSLFFAKKSAWMSGME